MRNSIIPAAYIVFLRDKNEILLQRRFNTGYQDGNYSLPAGHIEKGESPIHAGVREAAEEVGVTIATENLSMAHIMYRFDLGQDSDRVCFFIRASEWQGNPQNLEPEKCDDLAWFSLDRLPTNTIDYIREAIKNIQDGKFYSERN